MIGGYTNFLIASAGASAAFIGLLFVGMSIVNRDDANHSTRERRIVLAGSSFLALVDAFFVSIISFVGGTKTFAVANLVMAGVGLLGTSRLVPRAARAGVFAREFSTRRLNLVFAGGSVALYSAQLIVPIVLLTVPAQTTTLIRIALLILIGLYASALARAWEITGIRGSRTLS
ncbi:MAG: hypothetical protein JOZ92_02880 [Candidatus Dormibacteraeota bacterium]|nr:hypothetical protein [Candidatus Dormibacteraeota bacterium]